MTTILNSIIISGYVGKELTLNFLNKMLILKGYNVLYLQLDINDNINNIYVNDKIIDYTLIKNNEVIFDEMDLVYDIYKEYNCNILITRSSRYNSSLTPLVYGITKYNNIEITKITNNNFLSQPIPIVSVIQSREIMEHIFNICKKVSSSLIISEHHHFSYIKYKTGLDINYSYQSFLLALNISELINFILKDDADNIPFIKAKLYENNLFKLSLPKNIPMDIQIDTPYYISTMSKYNINFYCDALKTSFVADDVISWFSKKISKEDINLCIFNSAPSIELNKIVDSISKIKFETIYIVDYEEIGYSYNDLVYLDKYGTIPTTFNDWAETMYEAFSSKICQGIVMDNISSIFDWIVKYSGLHYDKKFNVLCVGSKKLINSLKSKL